MLKLTLLISGNLGYEILQYLFKKDIVKIVSIFTDYNSETIIDFANSNNIRIFIGNPRKQKNKITNFLNEIGETDLIFSINYLFIIEKELINYPKLFALNIHGSLLPKYRGRTPHVWAIINGETKTGITVHRINEGVDTGDILLQKEIVIKHKDTGNDILRKYNKIYPELVERSLKLIKENKTRFTKQDEEKATYFGKRTPSDGEINWNWTKERIYNWVRAQAKPYPGAFTFYKDKKIIIDKIEFSDYGFNYNDNNGKILNISQKIIKVSNGAVKIVSYRFNENKDNFIFKDNTILGK